MDLKRISIRKFLELYLADEFENENLFCSRLDESQGIIPVENCNIDLDTLQGRVYYVYYDKLTEYQEKIRKKVRDIKCEK